MTVDEFIAGVDAYVKATGGRGYSVTMHQIDNRPAWAFTAHGATLAVGIVAPQGPLTDGDVAEHGKMLLAEARDRLRH
jgi:hypothetical protein